MTTKTLDADVAELAGLLDVARSRNLLHGDPEMDELESLLLRMEAKRRGLCPYETYTDFVEDLNASLLRFEHIPLALETADRVVSGDIMRLIVMMPTRYLKTETFGRLLGAYVMRRYQHMMVGLASYSAEKSWEVSDDARGYYLLSGGTLSEATSAKRFWGPPHGGEFWAVGVDQGVIGRGYHLGIVDDPIDPEKVRSSIFQHRFERWWAEKWLQRQEPGARIILVMQRLGLNDPIDFLFRREVGEDTELAPEHWHVLALDEIKSDEPLGRWDGPMGLPKTCTLIEDKVLVAEEADRKIWAPRPLGQVLAPSRFTPAEVQRIQATSGTYARVAQRQQRPMTATGDFWKLDWFQKRVFDTLPGNAYNGGKDWDTAYGEEEKNAASAFIESYRGPPTPHESFRIYIYDLDWDWVEFPALVKWMADVAGPHYVEQKASGKSAVQSLKAAGIMAKEVPVKGNKLERASAAQPAVAQGRVWIHKDIYQMLLYGTAGKQGLLRVTAEQLAGNGMDGGLDLNDAFVQAIHRHLGLGSKKRIAGVLTR